MASQTTTLDSEVLRTQASRFPKRMRGYAINEVHAYLQRFALMLDVLVAGDEIPDLPASFLPGAVRAQKFQVVWQGRDVDEVRSFLKRLADDLEEFIANPPPLPEAVLHVPSKVGGDSVEAVIERNQRKVTVIFSTADELTADVAAQVAEHGVALMPTRIVVDTVSMRAMQAAFDQLKNQGRLDHLFG